MADTRHGGILDRIDGLLLAAPVCLVFIVIESISYEGSSRNPRRHDPGRDRIDRHVDPRPDRLARDAFHVEALTANRDVEKLAGLARRFGAKLAVIADPALEAQLCSSLVVPGSRRPAVRRDWWKRRRLPPRSSWLRSSARRAYPLWSPRFAAARPSPSQQGMPGVGRRVHDARSVDARRHPPAGRQRAQRHLPVFDANARPHIVRLILTASGGPFRAWTSDRMRAATPEQAVAHPNWSMGAKISVDSATMMNKGARGHRGTLPVRHARTAAGRGGAPAIRHPLAGRVCRRLDAGAAGRARHAHPRSPTPWPGRGA